MDKMDINILCCLQNPILFESHNKNLCFSVLDNNNVHCLWSLCMMMLHFMCVAAACFMKFLSLVGLHDIEPPPATTNSQIPMQVCFHALVLLGLPVLFCCSQCLFLGRGS